MCWLLWGSFDCFCCPRASVHRPSIAPRCVSVCVRPRCPPSPILKAQPTAQRPLPGVCVQGRGGRRRGTHLQTAHLRLQFPQLRLNTGRSVGEGRGEGEKVRDGEGEEGRGAAWDCVAGTPSAPPPKKPKPGDQRTPAPPPLLHCTACGGVGLGTWGGGHLGGSHGCCSGAVEGIGGGRPPTFCLQRLSLPAPGFRGSLWVWDTGGGGMAAWAPPQPDPPPHTPASERFSSGKNGHFSMGPEIGGRF